MKHSTIRGRIRYTSKKPDLMDQERGREWFAFTHHGDGSTTLRAQCEIEEPHPTVLRDVTYSLDPAGRPSDCLIRLTVGDRFLGAGLVIFTHAASGTVAECESYGPSIGRLTQRFERPHGIDGFGTHPIVGDGYLTRCMDVSRGPHQRTIQLLVPSPDHRGASPPMLADVRIDLEYVGDEDVDVPAGKFPCRHFRFLDDKGMGGTLHPIYDLWVTADSDCVFVAGGVAAPMSTWYELVELQRGPATR